ncbi:MAG TPA: glucose 1-dehydrogenase [Terracidiphilus sp.]|jgi:glucose 1-dehydrogenase/3-dehydrosphinganine reductase
MNRKDSSLEGKRILITGADRGIGAALAIRFAEMGAHLCVNLFSSVETSEPLLGQLSRASGQRVLAVQADVRDPTQIDVMFESAAEKLEGLDALVNNAGVESIHSALELSVEEWDRVLDTNLRGSFLCAQRAARIMRDQSGGVILNISSIHDSQPRLGTAHYCASKAGLTMLTRALAQEWAEHRIRVVGIAPGAVETAINEAAIAKIGRSRFEEWIPLSRLGNTDDICDAATYLISDQASYISGATLVVDGAYSLNGIQYDSRGDIAWE